MNEVLDEAISKLLEDMIDNLTDTEKRKPEQESLVAMKTSRYISGEDNMYALWCVVLTPSKEQRDVWAKIIQEAQGEWQQYHISKIPGLDIPKEE